MGYDRSLYVGPFIECKPKKKTKIVFGCPECWGVVIDGC